MKQPPLGVQPASRWEKQNPEPSLAQLIDRHSAVSQAIVRYRDAGKAIPKKLFDELGLKLISY